MCAMSMDSLPATPPPSPSIKESKAVPSPPKQATPPSQTQQGSNK